MHVQTVPQGSCTGTQTLIGQLDTSLSLQQLLVDNLCEFVAAARRWLAEPVEQGGGGGAVHRLNGGPEVCAYLCYCEGMWYVVYVCVCVCVYWRVYGSKVS
jgi:hypothetical protein